MLCPPLANASTGKPPHYSGGGDTFTTVLLNGIGSLGWIMVLRLAFPGSELLYPALSRSHP